MFDNYRRGELPFRHLSNHPTEGWFLQMHRDQLDWYQKVPPDTPIVQYIDDDIWALRVSNTFPVFDCIAQAHWIVVPCGTLRELLHRYNPRLRVRVLPTLIDLNDWPPSYRTSSHSLTVMRLGTKAVWDDELEPTLCRIRESHPEIQWLWVHCCPTWTYRHSWIQKVDLPSRYDTYSSFLRRSAPDLVIGSPDDGANKWMESTLSDAVYVGSDDGALLSRYLPPETFIFQHHEWFDVLSWLIRDVNSRRRLVDVSTRLIRSHHCWQSPDACIPWVDFLKEYHHEKEKMVLGRR